MQFLQDSSFLLIVGGAAAHNQQKEWICGEGATFPTDLAYVLRSDLSRSIARCRCSCNCAKTSRNARFLASGASCYNSVRFSYSR